MGDRHYLVEESFLRYEVFLVLANLLCDEQSHRGEVAESRRGNGRLRAIRTRVGTQRHRNSFFLEL